MIKWKIRLDCSLQMYHKIRKLLTVSLPCDTRSDLLLANYIQNDNLSEVELLEWISSM